jgi:hypothetical protein
VPNPGSSTSYAHEAGSYQAGSNQAGNYDAGTYDAGTYDEENGNYDDDSCLVLLERRVAAQAAVLARVPLSMPLPREVITLLAVAPRELDGITLPPRYLPRLVALFDQLQTLIDDVALRQRELGGRIAAVRSARRAGPAAHLVDYSS